MSEGKKPVGIRVDDETRITVRAELISNGLPGLIADLGSGLFVVTQDAAVALEKLGVDYKPVKINKGIPTSVRKFIRENAMSRGIAPPL